MHSGGNTVTNYRKRNPSNFGNFTTPNNPESTKAKKEKFAMTNSQTSQTPVQKPKAPTSNLYGTISEQTIIDVSPADRTDAGAGGHRNSDSFAKLAGKQKLGFNKCVSSQIKSERHSKVPGSVGFQHQKTCDDKKYENSLEDTDELESNLSPEQKEKVQKSKNIGDLDAIQFEEEFGEPEILKASSFGGSMTEEDLN